MKAGMNDAKLWADMLALLPGTWAERDRLGRQLVALVRRDRAKRGERTWGPGDDLPRDVCEVIDLDGDAWYRPSLEPGLLSDRWRMVGHNPAEHEEAAGEEYEPAELLEQYGPVSEAKR